MTLCQSSFTTSRRINRCFASLVMLFTNVPSVALLDQDLPILKGCLTTQNNFSYFAFDPPPFERRPAAAGQLIFRFDFVGRVFLYLNPCFGLFGEVKDFSWVSDGF